MNNCNLQGTMGNFTHYLDYRHFLTMRESKARRIIMDSHLTFKYQMLYFDPSKRSKRQKN